MYGRSMWWRFTAVFRLWLFSGRIEDAMYTDFSKPVIFYFSFYKWAEGKYDILTVIKSTVWVHRCSWLFSNFLGIFELFLIEW